MPRIRIDDLDDPRLDPYRQLRQRNPTAISGRFVVESRLLVERLVASSYEVESLVVDEGQLRALPSHLPESVNVWVVPSKTVSLLVGFDFHRGVLGCGLRKPWLDGDALLTRPKPDGWTGVLLMGVQDPENMGLIARTCAAMGIDDLFVGPHCVDPYARRVLRVSMGGMLQLRKYRVVALENALESCSKNGMMSVATTLSEHAVSLADFRRTQGTLVLLGNEAEGLPEWVQERAQTRLRIDMSPGTDSLNVSVAAGIVLHYLTRLA